jgi:glycosyltransferase involved in cell wall biosynthesis
VVTLSVEGIEGLTIVLAWPPSTSAGRLVSPDDPSALAEALIDVLGDERLQARSRRRGLRAARRAFSAERMARETAAVY